MIQTRLARTLAMRLGTSGTGPDAPIRPSPPTPRKRRGLMGDPRQVRVRRRRSTRTDSQMTLTQPHGHRSGERAAERWDQAGGGLRRHPPTGLRRSHSRGHVTGRTESTVRGRTWGGMRPRRPHRPGSQEAGHRRRAGPVTGWTGPSARRMAGKMRPRWPHRLGSRGAGRRRRRTCPVTGWLAFTAWGTTKKTKLRRRHQSGCVPEGHRQEGR